MLKHAAHVYVQLRQVAQVQIAQIQLVRVQQGREVEGTGAQIKGAAQVKLQGAGVKLEGVLQHIGVHREHGGHIEGSAVVGTELLAGEHIGLGVGHLLLHDGAGLGLLDDVQGEVVGVADA